MSVSRNRNAPFHVVAPWLTPGRLQYEAITFTSRNIFLVRVVFSLHRERCWSAPTSQVARLNSASSFGPEDDDGISLQALPSIQWALGVDAVCGIWMGRAPMDGDTLQTPAPRLETIVKALFGFLGFFVYLICVLDFGWYGHLYVPDLLDASVPAATSVAYILVTLVLID